MVMSDSGTETCTVFIAKALDGKGHVARDLRARILRRVRSMVGNGSGEERYAVDSKW